MMIISILFHFVVNLTVGGAIVHFVLLSADVQEEEEEEEEVTEAPHMDGGGHHKTIYILISHRRACILMKWRQTQKGQR